MRFLIPAVVLSVAATSAWAINGERPIGRFDDRHLPRVAGNVDIEAEPIDRLDPSDRLRIGWEAFSRRHGGGWNIHVDGRTGLPTLVSGRGVQLLSGEALAHATRHDVEAAVRAFLADRRPLMGDWSETLELNPDASTKIRTGHWQIVYRQVVDGVAVENSRLDFHVVQGRLVLFGARLWGAPRISGVPTIDAWQARAVLDAYLETSTLGFEPVEEPRLAMIAINPDPTDDGGTAWIGPRGEGVAHTLVWRFKFREDGAPATWVGEVDAHDGTMRAMFDSAQYATIQGGVFPVSNDDDCPEGGCEIVDYPMPFADFTEAGQSESTTDEFGNLTCTDPGATFETNLSGPYVDIHDNCGPIAMTGSCDGDLTLGLKQGENCASASPGGVTAAARSSFFHINRIAELARFYNPSNTWLNSPLTVDININSSCNANWSGGEINMYGEGNGCGNTGEQQGVLVHEWGHGYDEFDGGGSDAPSEAYADVVAIFTARDSCMSRGWYNDGRTCSGYGDTCLTCTGIRDHDWAARVANTPATPLGFFPTYCPSGVFGACSYEAHCESYVISEAIFDLATRDLPAAGYDQDTAWQLAERIWYLSRPGSGGDIYSCFRLNLTNSCGATHWMQRMRVADDDDGDLSNGTPNAAAIFAAFDRHDISCGSASDPENQSTSSCPTLAAPQLSVTAGGSGAELSWTPVSGAAEYRVYRGENGCDRQQTPIASVPGTQTSYADATVRPGFPVYYRVEAFTSNPSCHSPVSTCEATPVGARLQMSDYQIQEDPDASNGDGMPDPGETLRIPVTLFNSGAESGAGVTGSLVAVAGVGADVIDPAVTFADVPLLTAVGSDAPHFGVTLQEDAPCGQTLEFRFESQAANDITRTAPIHILLGDPQRDFRNEQQETIPPQTVEPVISTIVIDQDRTIADLDVTTRISHEVFGEVIVELTSPEGTTVRLHDQSVHGATYMEARYDLQKLPDGPGTMDDFIGESTLGTWTLSIQDVGPASTWDGTLQFWTIHAEVDGAFDCDPYSSCAEPIPGAVPGLTVTRSGADLDLGWDAAVGATGGYNVLQSSAPDFSSGAVALGNTAGTTWTITDGVSGTPDLTFFQVRAVNGCQQEGP